VCFVTAMVFYVLVCCVAAGNCVCLFVGYVTAGCVVCLCLFVCCVKVSVFCVSFSSV
jgi:hypothetical protein